MADVTIFNPEQLSKPRSPFLQIALAETHRWAFIAGQVPLDEHGDLVGRDDFIRQCDQVFGNIGVALRAVGADWTRVVQFTSYLVRREDVAPFRQYRERAFPKLFPNGAFPPNTLLLVNGLADERYLLEVQTVAALS